MKQALADYYSLYSLSIKRRSEGEKSQPSNLIHLWFPVFSFY